MVLTAYRGVTMNFANPLLYGRESEDIKDTPLVLPPLEEEIYGAFARFL